MAEITITNSQGIRLRSNVYTPIGWDTGHDQDSAGNTTTSNESGNNAVVAVSYSGYGGGTYSIYRVALDFDLSGITAGSTINSAKLKLYGASATSPHFTVTVVEADFIVLQGTFTDGSTLDAATYNDFSGHGSGWDGTDSGVIEYSGEEASSWSTSGYNEVTLNADCLSDITSRAGSSTRLACYIIEHDHDYHDNINGENGNAVNASYDVYKVNFNINPSATNPPQLVVDYTEPDVEPTATFGINFNDGSLSSNGGDITIK